MKLPRILFAWEMGENFGHVSKIAETARALHGRAELWVAVRNPIALRQMAPDLDVKVLAAPAAPPHGPISAQDAGLSYPDALRHVGWAQPRDLAPLVEAWRSLFSLVRPDVLVAQAAPTSLLAARGLDLTTAMIGSGFDAPPRAHPMPSFYHWDPKLKAPTIERETGVLKTANSVLLELGAPKLDRFCDLLDTDAYLLATFTEIDHYAPRDAFEPAHPEYLGQLITSDKGAELRWRADAQHRILAYLRPTGRPFEAGAKALEQLDARFDVILACPGAPPGMAERLAKSTVRLVDGPVRLDGLIEDCDLGISHASNGIAAAFIMTGVPQIGLPNHSEQIMVAQAVGRSRLGFGLAGQYGVNEVLRTIDTVLSSDGIRSTAWKTGKRLSAQFPDGPTPALANAILNLA
ncbi:MAG: hypothetical protein AAGD13_08775 [Pseudomonadota bacterium]